MPRPQTESSRYLDIYKLTVEKKRLQQELSSLEQRRQQIMGRLSQLEGQIDTLESSAQSLRHEGESISSSTPTSAIFHPDRSEVRHNDDLNALLLEY